LQDDVRATRELPLDCEINFDSSSGYKVPIDSV